MSDVTRKMEEGELNQGEQYGRTDLSVEEQLEICRRKTAHLFSGCGRLGAILADMDEQQEEKLGTYGHSVGMAFQLTDDLLDYTGVILPAYGTDAGSETAVDVIFEAGSGIGAVD